MVMVNYLDKKEATGRIVDGGTVATFALRIGLEMMNLSSCETLREGCLCCTRVDVRPHLAHRYKILENRVYLSIKILNIFRGTGAQHARVFFYNRFHRSVKMQYLARMFCTNPLLHRRHLKVSS